MDPQADMDSVEVDSGGASTASPTQPMAEKVDTCLQALERASSDNEVFAALLLVANVVQAETTDAATRKRIFDAVGFQFINRLLKAAAKPEKKESGTYRSLAVTLLGCFSTSPELAGHSQMVSKIPVLIEVIQGARASLQDEEKQTVDDAYQILVTMAMEESPRKALCCPEVISVLCGTMEGRFYGCDRAEELLLLLLHHCGQHVWRLNKPQIDSLVHKLASQFKECQDESKFQVCEVLARLLFACSSVPMEQSEWSQLVFKGVSDILMSKVAEKQRDPALRLASLMVGHFGMSWALGPGHADKKFLLLLIHMACVETRMALESPDHQYTSSKESVLVSCFSLLEQCIEYLTCGPTLDLDDRQVVQLHTAMTGAFGAVMHYLQGAQFDKSWPDQPLVVAAVRVLCVWLAEETTALKDQVYQLLPFLIKVVEKSFREVSNSKHLASVAAASTAPQSLRSFASTDLLRLLLPALCHLTAEDEPRARLVEEGGIELLGECFSYHWKRFVDGDEDGDSEIALTTLCSVFLNVTLQDAEAVQRHSTVFKELLCLLASALAHTVVKTEHLILSFNFAVLGLTLLRTLANHTDVQNLSAIKKFVGRTLDLFKASFQVTGDNVHEVCEAYQPYWADVNELWLLGIQVLSECLICIPWLPSTCLQSGYLQHIIGLLKIVVAETVEEETIIVYSALLGSVAKTEVAPQLKQMGAVDIARKFKMEELSVSLQVDPR
ncbi:neurochondrin-like [Acanthaster planci]|uniref:Neurochondrin-like n=1 Tax=Acanthaster planci TaxID=133434 RepID=A0A8B7Y2F6_ACAPL|nr:neurochondrin-like [Acanthaster planci]XP_022086712.1 neurochondrin-like [Acanthaster planci]XP_022086714.1 neurochondrin-like [Acanthaster planci]